ncbi:phage portal protein [Ktedonobacter robiniae]|uniref:Uncharacterized protein n=1 Tax=Ktedonobacter robiniae TaxID=2778365 RepID=A0ABQ3UW26_9CHLR|nr:phage portal protein [Ktedonobacter robiniae]GHO56615.1 hypothetical protein KSB_50900 [Ktedonobacter robiniae]
MEQKQQISWFGRIRQAVSGGARDARISEQMNPGFFSSTAGVEEERRWGYASGTEEDYYWRRLSDNFYLKDLVPSAYLEMHNQVYEAYHANPLAFAIIEMTTSFVLGRGVKLDASNKRVKKLLDEFWQANSMDERVYTICNELALYGEIFVRYFVNRFDGSVKVRLTDPSLIDQIETDPEDIETPLRFHRRPVGESASAPSSTTGGLKLVFRPGERETEGEWFEADSQMQQFAINKVSNAKRGNSDLATMLPWLRRYKDWLTDRVRINKYKGAFIWDVTLRGADRKTIDTKRMEYSTPPQPGSVLLHNEAESWQVVQPAINANDAKEDGRALKLMIAVGVLFLTNECSKKRWLPHRDNAFRLLFSPSSLLGLDLDMKNVMAKGLMTVKEAYTTKVVVRPQEYFYRYFRKALSAGDSSTTQDVKIQLSCLYRQKVSGTGVVSHDRSVPSQLLLGY